jgi:orotidine-5'-phosphate decarboxylase
MTKPPTSKPIAGEPRPGRRIFAAIDTTDLHRARVLATELADVVGGLKLGLEFFTARGPEGIEAVAQAGLPVFLDLKLHDIPNTVASAVRAVLPLRPALLTVHAAGGPAMLRAAAEAAAEADDARPRLVAVTVLTSLDGQDLDRVGQRGPVAEQVLRLAELAQGAGIDGVVCSPREVALLRAKCGPDFTLVVPGIRPAWAAAGDQKRVMTPAEAVAAGADYLVIGRPITGAEQPRAAAERIAAELAVLSP